jgi:enolase
MFTIQSIAYRKVLNSGVKFTTEFIVYLDDGSVGIGAAPQGETISIYEDRAVSIEPETIIHTIEGDQYLGRALEQEGFDGYLQQHIPTFGRNNAFALSLAFFDATRVSRSLFELFDRPEGKLSPPRVCFNILNGGRHAYTNPVLSDFAEYSLVSRSNNVEEMIANHNEIQRVVKERLLGQTKTAVAGNPVNCFATADNRECLDFLLDVRDGLGLSDAFDLMIDVSAGDFLTDDGYHFAITDGSVRSSEEFRLYWLDIIRQYGLRFLEDPFHEQDYEGWQRLTTDVQACVVIADNFYSSDAAKIEEGAAKNYAHAALIKPNQAGTVTAVRRAIEAAQRTGQIAITSQRSISTESTFLAELTCMYELEHIKFGPLSKDYSSVMQLNEIIRLTEERR